MRCKRVRVCAFPAGVWKRAAWSSKSSPQPRGPHSYALSSARNICCNSALHPYYFLRLYGTSHRLVQPIVQSVLPFALLECSRLFVPVSHSFTPGELAVKLHRAQPGRALEIRALYLAFQSQRLLSSVNARVALHSLTQHPIYRADATCRQSAQPRRGPSRSE